VSGLNVLNTDDLILEAIEQYRKDIEVNKNILNIVLLVIIFDIFLKFTALKINDGNKSLILTN